MKKSLIALAVLGAVAGAAQAQSSVTLYGLVDLNVGSASTTTYVGNVGTKKSVTKMTSGSINASRWGLKGTEDLGGGLSALFVVESGFSADTGAGNTGPNRRSVIGLSGGFGTVTLGNEYSALDDVAGSANSGFDSDFSASINVLAVNNNYTSRPKNAIKYVSPDFGGFSGGFSYALDEVAGVKNDQTDFSLSYSGGPVNVNFGYEVIGDQSGSEDLKFSILNGSYDLGMAKLMASFGQEKLGNAKSTDTQFGVDVPLSSALTLSAGFAQSKDKVGGADAGKRTGFGLAGKYTLSKRTFAYAGVQQAKSKTAAGNVNGKSSFVAVGLQHRF